MRGKTKSPKSSAPQEPPSAAGGGPAEWIRRRREASDVDPTSQPSAETLPESYLISAKDTDPLVRLAALQKLANIAPTIGAATTVLSAATNDESDTVREAARNCIGTWGPMFTKALQEALSTFHLASPLEGLSITPVENNVSKKLEQSEPIAAARAKIGAAVSDMPSVSEQREAEVCALLDTVASDANYSSQIRGFTEITRTLRKHMAERLTPLFRTHLRTESPQLNVDLEKDKRSQYADLALRKGQFADACTDELFRLGLVLGFEKKHAACYLGAIASAPNYKGRYRIFACGERKHLQEVTDWQTRPEVVDKLWVQDGAPENGRNALAPFRNR